MRVRPWHTEGRMRTRNEYLDLRRRYEPETGSIRLVLIAESPPASGKYFYDPTGVPSEPLFAALMKQLGLSRLPAAKEAGLCELQRRGWVLVDATYEPVDRLSTSGRKKVIDRDYPLLRGDLEKLTPDHSAPVVLIKANVCRILAPKLVHDGFRVLNGRHAIPFPSTGHQIRFHEQFSAILKAAAAP